MKDEQQTGKDEFQKIINDCGIPTDISRMTPAQLIADKLSALFVVLMLILQFGFVIVRIVDIYRCRFKGLYAIIFFTANYTIKARLYFRSFE